MGLEADQVSEICVVFVNLSPCVMWYVRFSFDTKFSAVVLVVFTQISVWVKCFASRLMEFSLR